VLLKLTPYSASVTEYRMQHKKSSKLHKIRVSNKGWCEDLDRNESNKFYDIMRVQRRVCCCPDDREIQ